MHVLHTLGRKKKKIQNSLEVISLCVPVLVWPGLPLGTWHFSARSHLARAATWMPDGLFAREEEEEEEGKPCPPCKCCWEKAWQGINVKIGEKNGKSVSEIVEERLSWAELPGLGSGAGSEEVPSNKCLVLQAQGWGTGGFCAHWVWLGFSGAVTMPVPALWRAFSNAASAQAASSAPVW